MPGTPQIDATTRRHPTLVYWSAAAVAGLVLYGSLPRGVVVFNDDFGYMRSVLETASRGRPWTDDWLGPWSASLSIISAMVFKATGSFRLATHGLQGVLWGLFVAALSRIFLLRQFPSWSAFILALTVCFIPTVLWKGLEFTSLVIYLPCLALCIGAALQNRWGLFAIGACVALASRQSSAAWFIIPIIEMGRALFDSSPSHSRLQRCRAPLMACLAGAITLVVCFAIMNQTHAQRTVTAGIGQSLQPAALGRTLAFALLLGLICTGAANALLWIFRKTGRDWSGYTKTEVFCRAIAPVLIMAVLLGLRRYEDVQLEHDFYRQPAGIFSLVTWVVLGVFGWIIAPFKLDPRLLGGAMAAAVLACLRIATWDYYWIDFAFFAFFAVIIPTRDLQPESRANTSAPQSGHFSRLLVAVACLAILTAPSAAWIARAKIIMDDSRAREVVLEQSLREGKISPADLSSAPFGFSAWNLFPYFITTPEGAHGYIADFKNYLHEDSLSWETRGADNPDPITDPESVVGSGVFRIGWRSERHQFILRRQKQFTPAKIEIVSHNYHRPAFPLNDAEWRQYSPP